MTISLRDMPKMKRGSGRKAVNWNTTAVAKAITVLGCGRSQGWKRNVLNH